MSQKYYFKFERRQVDRLEMDMLLDAFNADEISDYSLKAFCGTVHIDFGGYLRSDPHPILIPELRQFLRLLAQRWGAAAVPFFCEFTSGFVPLYFTAQLDHLLVVERPAKDEFALYHRKDELAALENSAHLGIQQLGNRAGMTLSTIQQRQETLSRLLSKLFCHLWHEGKSSGPPASGQFSPPV